MRLLLSCSLALTIAASADAQTLDTVRTLGALRDLGEACRLDQGRTWGRSLCGPLALVEPSTRLVVASDTVHTRPAIPLGGAWVTTLPDDLGLANTSFTWGDRPWAMVLTHALPSSRFARLALLAHESFHREQAALRLTTRDALNAHLDEEDGRRLLRLELRALASALASNGAERRSHIESALFFRAQRRARFAGSDTLERLLEMQEGLAEYTGNRVALLLFPDSLPAVVRAIRAMEERPTFVRSFAYGTGPGLGLLLDATVGDAWRDSVRAAAPSPVDLAALLARGTGVRVPAGSALARAAERRTARYDGATVAREESARAEGRRRRAAAYRAKLVDGPVLALRQQGLQRAFNPNELFPLGELGTVYPTGTFSAPWGRLQVVDGALASPDFALLRVAAPATVPTEGPIAGPGWTLHLAEGWTLRPGQRPGDYEAVRDTP